MLSSHILPSSPCTVFRAFYIARIAGSAAASVREAVLKSSDVARSGARRVAPWWVMTCDIHSSTCSMCGVFCSAVARVWMRGATEVGGSSWAARGIWKVQWRCCLETHVVLTYTIYNNWFYTYTMIDCFLVRIFCAVLEFYENLWHHIVQFGVALVLHR